MTRQNLAATALYFEKRASRAPTLSSRNHFEAAALHYRVRAKAAGHRLDDGIESPRPRATVPARRQRLIDMCRAYNNAAP